MKLKKNKLQEALKSKQIEIKKKWGSNPKQIQSGGHN